MRRAERKTALAGLVMGGILLMASTSYSADFIVNSTADLQDNDTADDLCDTGVIIQGQPECTLRAALEQANATAGSDLIQFDIAGGGIQTISPASTLPTITESVTIDGASQPGYASAPLIVLDGGLQNVGGNGLEVTGGQTTINGLVIQGFGGHGIALVGAGNNIIQANYIGTDEQGGQAVGNGNSGILIDDSSANLIGGAISGWGNLISGNGTFGIEIVNLGSTGNQVQGNSIGTNLDGTAALENAESGILLDTAPGNTIGGASAGAGNLISGNGKFGIEIVQADGNQLLGNTIGLDRSGSAALENADSGVRIDDSANTTVGGVAIEARNVISGNGKHGIELRNTGTTGTQILGNYVGTDVSGTFAIGNARNGIRIDKAPVNAVGSVDGGNLISGNAEVGLEIRKIESSDNQVIGNLIGTDASGMASLGNGLDGILIDSAPNNVIGRGGTGEKNTIAGNGENGIQILGVDARGNQVMGNLIGLASDGTTGLGNTLNGILLTGDASGNLIGFPSIRRRNPPLEQGALAGAAPNANSIAFNGGDGIYVETGTQNTLFGNSIHSNGELGIDLDANGVSANDPNDPDTGANNLQNFPIITSATSCSTTGITTVSGSLDSIGNSSYLLEFFSDLACDPSGNGEARDFLAAQLLTLAQGPASFQYNLPATVTPGSVIMATATSGGVDTSELSACISVALDPGCAPGLPQLTIADVTVMETASGTVNAILTVGLSASAGVVTVDYTTVPETATPGSDYASTSGSLTISAGSSTATITIPVNGDTLQEADETFFVSLSNPAGATISDGIGQVTIQNLVILPSLSIGSVSLFEGNAGTTTATFAVSLSDISNQNVTVDYATANGTASSGTDYNPAATTLTFPAGTTSQAISVLVLGDTLPEANETFYVDLSNPSGADIAVSRGIGTILDDDGPVAPIIPALPLGVGFVLLLGLLLGGFHRMAILRKKA